MILKAAAASRSLDNITVVLVSFSNFKRGLKLKKDQTRTIDSTATYRSHNIDLLNHEFETGINIDDIYQQSEIIVSPKQGTQPK
jgi:hypothetical protein